jgi:ribonuclease E
MLINATRAEEVRAAILNDGKLEQFEIEVQDAGLLKGNVYRGVVANVEASLNACFVDIGADKQGFLPVDEIHPSAFHSQPKKTGKKERPRIEDVMRKGGEIIVQVVKDAVGNKGAALTSQVSLAGRYIVLMPLDDSRGVSRRIADESRRKKIKEIAAGLKIPAECGFIVRTAGMNRTKTDLNRDGAQLVRTWKEIVKQAATEDGTKSKPKSRKRGRRGERRTPKLLFEDRDLVVRMIRDYYTSDIEEILVDNAQAYLKAREYIHTVMPRSRKAITLYEERMPLFAQHRVEEQIEAVFARRVDLPSGGYILIDPTEALTSIDVNSGRSTRAKSQEETAVHTNIEAASEIARQLRLRDLGGLIVIDFIDMSLNKQNRQVEKTIKDALKVDKARSYVSKISENGLLEVNRQRIKQALQFQTHTNCTMCEGTGTIPTPEFVSLGLIRKIEAKAATGLIDKAVVTLHPEIATFVQNTRRRDLIELEDRFGIIVQVEGRTSVRRNQVGLHWASMSQLSEAERHALEVRREALAARSLAEAALRREELMHGDSDASLDAELEKYLQLVSKEEAELEETSRPVPKVSRADQRRERRTTRRASQLRGERLALPDPAAAKADEPKSDSAQTDTEAQAPDNGTKPDSSPGEAAAGTRRKKRRRRRRKRGGDESVAKADGPGAEPPVADQPREAPAAAAPPVETVDSAAEQRAFDDSVESGNAPGSALVPPPADGLFGA